MALEAIHKVTCFVFLKYWMYENISLKWQMRRRLFAPLAYSDGTTNLCEIDVLEPLTIPNLWRVKNNFHSIPGIYIRTYMHAHTAMATITFSICMYVCNCTCMYVHTCVFKNVTI